MANDLEKLNFLSESKSSAWMLSFIDTLSILITFFILVYATSSPIKQIDNNILEKKDTTNIAKNLNNTDDINHIILSKITRSDFHNQICVIKNKNNIQMIIAADHLFIGKTADFKVSSQKMILVIADILNEIDNFITITGVNYQKETNHQKKDKEIFKLSINRAVTMAQKLFKLGYNNKKIQTKGLVVKSYNLYDNICKMNSLNRMTIEIENYSY